MDIKNILFWIFLIFGLILLLWNVFGDSPTEFIALAALIFTVLLKVSRVSERMTKLETKFNFLARDFKTLSNDFKEHIKHKK